MVEENEYLRTSFDNSSKSSDTTQFEQREKSVVEIHRLGVQNSKLTEDIQQLEFKLGQRENNIKILEDNSQGLSSEVVEIKTKLRDFAHILNDFSIDPPQQIREELGKLSASIEGLTQDSVVKELSVKSSSFLI